jgi:hypothetical protein
MATIILRNVKGSPLTNAEVDANFNNINTEVGSKLNSSAYTATDVISKIKSVDIYTADINVARLNGYNAATTNTVGTIVARDLNGDFSAGTITAVTLIGNVTGNITGNLTGTVTGNATNVNGTVAINNGGTGGTTAASARTNLELGSIATQNSNSVSITGGSISGLSNAIAIIDGGTGAINATQARGNLGLVIGSDVQPFSNLLTSISALTTSGLLIKSGNNSVARTITGGTNITVVNGDGASGNPTISVSGLATVATTGSYNDLTNKPNTVPQGLISLWYGSILTIPSGWAICDGANGTPDLRDRFVVGAGTSYAVGATGGSKDAVVVSHTHSATSTVTDPGHSHPNSGSTSIGAYPYTTLVAKAGNTSTATTGITVATTVASAGVSGTNANLPPYYALAYIMKL